MRCFAISVTSLMFYLLQSTLFQFTIWNECACQPSGIESLLFLRLDAAIGCCKTHAVEQLSLISPEAIPLADGNARWLQSGKAVSL
jgi:hypothetical protein